MVLELYRDLVALYEKTHAVHIRTVKVPDCATLHPTLGEHYETLQGMVDSLGEDVIQKIMGEDVPGAMECLKKATVDTETEHADAEEIVQDMLKDYAFVVASFEKCAKEEKNLLAQNVLLELWGKSNAIYADMCREVCEEEYETPKEEEKESEKPKPNIGIKAA